MEASSSTSMDDTEIQTAACVMRTQCSSDLPGFLGRQLLHEDTWREADEDAVTENHALAGTIEDQANHCSAKRQRRPNVRLEDLGDQHASPAADKRKKKTGKSLAAGVCVSNGGCHKWSSFDSGDDAQRGDNAPSCNFYGSVEHCAAGKNATKVQQILKITGKKVRKWGKIPGVPKVDAPVEKLHRLSQSGTSIRAHDKQKVLRKQDAKDIHFDKENNGHPQTRFEASDYHDVIRKRSEMVPLHAQQNYQFGDMLTARTQARGERANEWTQASSRMHAFKLTDDADGRRVALHVPKGKLVLKANGSMHGMRNKHAVDGNGNGDSRETGEKNTVSQCLQPWLGVRGWLQDLGLGRYAQLFEAHEVEPEVLPLLTLDDLREMGVAAVGSRRKMFYAIQHIRKALMAETE